MSKHERSKGWWLWSINPISVALWPFSFLFCILVHVRIRLYRWHWFKSFKLDKPVIIVGNISVGGTGKTPVVQILVNLLKEQGRTPAILTRGYKSDFEADTLLLEPGQHSEQAGDEANMLAELCDCPMALGADRVKTAQALLKRFPQIDVLVADDGLQHYALQRDMEIAVFQPGAYGNGFCLPAGPLREPQSRLRQVDLVIERGSQQVHERFGQCWNLQAPDLTRALDSFCGQAVYALAGIGLPHVFFEGLEKAGLSIQSFAFSDHHRFQEQDIQALQDRPILVTHKDAVKLRGFASDNIWVVPLELELSDDLQYHLNHLLESKLRG